MRRRTPSEDRPGRRSRAATTRDVATAVAVVLGAGTVLAFDASADSGPLDLRPAAEGAVAPAAVPVTETSSATTAGEGTRVVEHHDRGALAAARRAAVQAATDQLAARRAAAREAEERAATDAAAAAAAERAAVWDRLADCESGAWDRAGRPIPGTATWDYGLRASEDGFFQGGLQFHPVTWDEFRDAGMPGHAGRASRAQQIAIAERVLDAQGWGAWPACSKKLGYR